MGESAFHGKPNAAALRHRVLCLRGTLRISSSGYEDFNRLVQNEIEPARIALGTGDLMLTALTLLVTFMSAREKALVSAILVDFRVIPLAIDS